MDEVYRRILLFEESLEKADGWLKVPETGMTEADASAYEVKLFGAKIRCFNKALEAAVETMGKGNVGENWNSWCDKACAFRRSIGGT